MDMEDFTKEGDLRLVKCLLPVALKIVNGILCMPEWTGKIDRCSLCSSD
jgi:hypothetical protein